MKEPFQIEWMGGAGHPRFKEMSRLVQERMKGNPRGRAGDPAEFGDACAFLCSAKIGFIVGQNLLLDGGAFNSSMG